MFSTSLCEILHFIQDDSAWCPRRNSLTLIRRFPSNWTSRNDNAPLPVAMTNSFWLLRILPGFPRRLITVAEKIFRLRMPFVETVINAPGQGSNARIFLSIASAGSDQSILPSSRFSFGAYVANALSCGVRGAFPLASKSKDSSIVSGATSASQREKCRWCAAIRYRLYRGLHPCTSP